jgi:hypothetical protein
MEIPKESDTPEIIEKTDTTEPSELFDFIETPTEDKPQAEPAPISEPEITR